MKKSYAILAALCAILVAACKVSVDDGQETAPAPADLTGTYVTQARGHNLGKDWAYSGALVLDSTNHFGLSLTMTSDQEPPKTTSLNGTYSISRTTRSHNRSRSVVTTVTLRPERKHDDKPTLRVSGDTLRYSGPWWFNAGLSALGVADPVLVRYSTQVSRDSLPATVSSTPAKLTSAPSPAKK